MVAEQTIFRGTKDEAATLIRAVVEHCTCESPTVCASHRMLVDDQRALDGLLFMRRTRDRLIREEHRR